MSTILLGFIGGGQIFIILAVVVLWIWALVDVLRSEFKSNNKIIWILVVLLLGILGALLYLLIGRSHKLLKE
jgi:cell division protein FtsX